MLGKPPLFLVAAALVGGGVGVGAPEEGAGKETQAKKAVARFFEALKAKDIDALMKEADVPFCREGGMIIEKRDALKQFFQKALEVRDLSKDTVAIKLVTTLPELEKSEGKFTDDERKAAAEALGKDHRVVKVEWNRFGEGKHKTLIFVRIKTGQAKVVGII